MSDVVRRGFQARPFRFIPAAWIAAAGIAAMFMGSTLLTPLYALYQREHGFSELTLTLVYSAYVVGNMAALLLLGRLSDQVGRRPTRSNISTGILRRSAQSAARCCSSYRRI